MFKQPGWRRGSVAHAWPEPTDWLNRTVLMPLLEEVRGERRAEIERIATHVELSLGELLYKADNEIGAANARN